MSMITKSIISNWDSLSEEAKTWAVERVSARVLAQAGIEPREILAAAPFDAVEEVAAAIAGSAVVEGCLVLDPGTIVCSDGNAEVEYTDLSAKKAARSFVCGGGYAPQESTYWVPVQTWRVGIDSYGREMGVDEGYHSIAVHPAEPKCLRGRRHDWRSPHRLLGGLRENPGVWGHGPGLIIREVCCNCGTYRIRDTWAQDPETGIQGLDSVRYEEPCEDSEAWAAEMRSEAA